MKAIISLFRRNRHAGESVVFGTLGAALLVYSLYSHYQVDVAWKLSPYLFPVFISILFILVSVSMFLQGLKTGEEPRQNEEGKESFRKVAGFIGLVIVYYILLPYLGFLITDTLMLFFFLLYLGVRPWWKGMIFSVSLTIIIYVVFQVLLNVRLPQGMF